MKTIWTAAKIQDLTKRWGRGDRASVIGKALGCSRQAVLGKLNRLGLLGQVTQADKRRRMSEGAAECQNRPDVAAAKSLSMSRYWAEPGMREAQSKRMEVIRARLRQAQIAA